MATEPEKVKPQLLAFILCEKVVLDDEIPIIWRIVDTFNFVLPSTTVVPQDVQERLRFPLRCEVFTRWGPPAVGEYKAELGLILPDGKEADERKEQTFSMEGEYSFSHVMWRIEAGLSVAGTYNWVLFLDGEEIARHPFRLNITPQSRTSEAQ